MPTNPNIPDQAAPASVLYTVQEFRAGAWHDILSTHDEAAAYALQNVVGDSARVAELAIDTESRSAPKSDDNTK